MVCILPSICCATSERSSPDGACLRCPVRAGTFTEDRVASVAQLVVDVFFQVTYRKYALGGPLALGQRKGGHEVGQQWPGHDRIGLCLILLRVGPQAPIHAWLARH